MAGRSIRRVVVLGHTGFIGSRLVREFEAAGVPEVGGISDPDLDLADPGCQSPLAASFGEGTAVVLCAAVKRQFGDTLDVYHKNMAIVENVAAAALEGSVERLSFMSSAAVYGEETHNVDIRESTPVNPTSYYGIAKFTGECLLRKAFSAAQAPSLVCFRPPLVYGPGDRGRTYGPAGFSAAIRAGETITLWGDGSELREFLYIDDLCQILCHLTLGSFAGAVNIVSGRSYRFADVLAVLREVAPGPIVVNQRERSKKKVDNAFDPALLRSLLPTGFEFTPLAEGVRTTFNATI